MYKTDYKPTVAWRASLTDVLLFSASSGTTPAVYKLKVNPQDVNDVGYADIQIGYVLVDYVGHMYTITENLGSYLIKVTDDLFAGECPQNGMQAVVCKTIDGGTAPLIPQAMFAHLDRSAKEYVDNITHDILRRTRTRVYFNSVMKPTINNYQQDYAFHYGEFPSFKLVIPQLDGSEWYQLIEPSRYFVDGKLDHVVFDMDGDAFTGYIIIER